MTFNPFYLIFELIQRLFGNFEKNCQDVIYFAFSAFFFFETFFDSTK